MEQEWKITQAWVAHFDILGFKSMVKHKNRLDALQFLQYKLDSVIRKLKKDIEGKSEHVDFQFYADTFIIYSRTKKYKDYPLLVRAAKNFIVNCIHEHLPVRGAISYGELIFGHGRKIILGEAFLESYRYGQDQNWVGLILTPSASTRLKNRSLNPANHGFVNRDIPMRKFPIIEENIYAYRFINGSTNFPCPLLSSLEEMLQEAPLREKVKFVNTIRFIKKHYTIHNTKN